MTENVLIIGFGEAGQAIAAGWQDADCDVSVMAYDLKLDHSETRPGLVAAANKRGVALPEYRSKAFSSVTHVLSVVTADEALNAATRAAGVLPKGAVFWDMNSVAPQTKRAACQVIEGAGLRYLDVGVIAPIHPKRHRAPLMIAGQVDDQIKAAIQTFEFNAEVLSSEVGQAAGFKLLRSIVIKGVESLLVEFHIAGEKMGLTQKAAQSLAASFPGIDWPERVEYALERVSNHGPRRAAEMEEAAKFVDGLGLNPLMAEATSKRLRAGTTGSGWPTDD